MSLRGRIISSFIGIILLFVIALVSVSIFYTSAISNYKKISDELILENTLTTKVNELLESYTTMVVALSSEDRALTYSVKRDELLELLSDLDSIVTNDNVKVAYRGLKNIITGIIDDLENGHKASRQGMVVEAANYYNMAIVKKAYVEPNVTTLFLQQIKNLDELQSEINYKYKNQLLLVSLWILATVLVTILYALLFSQKITKPINILSNVAEKVSAGNYKYKIQSDLFKENSEVGRLAKSFDLMLEKLNLKISQVEENNRVILETQKNLKEQNEELEKFNNIVVGRELKMIELKKHIQDLELEISNNKQ